MFNHWLIAVCALTFYIIPHGGESAFRPRVSFTSLAFQASTFANSVISPCCIWRKRWISKPHRKTKSPLLRTFEVRPLPLGLLFHMEPAARFERARPLRAPDYKSGGIDQLSANRLYHEFWRKERDLNAHTLSGETP